MREQALLHHLLGAQAVAAMDQRHLLAHLRQVERLLDRGVAAADDGHALAAEEEPVAGGAGRDAGAGEVPLAVQAQPARLGTGGDDQGVGGVGAAAVEPDPERPGGQVDAGDEVEQQLGAAVRRLLRHLLHQPGALDDLGEARIVLDVGGDRHLAARLQALDDDRRQIGAGGVDRRRQAGGAGADDQHLDVSARRS